MPPMEDIGLIYEDFNDLIPGENPLSDGGRWGTYDGRPTLMVRDTGGDIHGTVEFPVNGSYYRTQAFNGPVIEAYGCTQGGGLGAALESWRIVALIGDPDDYIGYSSAYGGGIGEAYFFRRYNGGPTNFVGIGDGTPGLASAPEKLGIRILSDRVEQWAYASGAWHLVQTALDVTHRGPTYFALETEEQGGTEEVTWTCFGAGVPNRTQIYRILRGQG